MTWKHREKPKYTQNLQMREIKLKPFKSYYRSNVRSPLSRKNGRIKVY
jgi:hypothetical protein